MNNVMDDKARLDDLLSQEKFLVSSYGTLLCEASVPKLRSVMDANLSECADDQFEIFDQLSRRSWYQTQPAQPAQIAQTVQKFAGEA